VTGTYTIKFKVSNPAVSTTYVKTWQFTIEVQNDCNKLPSVNVNHGWGWLQFNGVNHSQDMVIPYKGVFVLNPNANQVSATQSACQVMTANSEFKLADSAYKYGSDPKTNVISTSYWEPFVPYSYDMTAWAKTDG